MTLQRRRGKIFFVGNRIALVAMFLFLSASYSTAGVSDNTTLAKDPAATYKLSPVISFLLEDVSDSEYRPPEPEPDPEIGPRPSIPEAFPGKFIVQIESEAGERLGRGNSFVFTQLNSNIYLDVLKIGGTGFYMTVDGWGIQGEDVTQVDRWKWIAALPEGAAGLLVPKIYSSVARYPNNGSSNGLNVSASGESCNPIDGEFEIFEIEYENGTITKLVADFVQYCSLQIPRSRGSIYYDASRSDAILPPNPPPLSGPVPATPELVQAGAMLKIEGGNGSFIAPDPVSIFNDLDSNFTVTQAGAGVRIEVQSAGLSSTLEFYRAKLDIDPNRDDPLTVGSYTHAIKPVISYPAAWISVSNGSRRCNKSKGSFNIYEIVYDENQEIDRLVMDFEHACSHETLFAKGSFRYDRTLPAQVLPNQPIPTGDPYPYQPTLQYSGAQLAIVGDPGDFITQGSSYYLDSYLANFHIESSDSGIVTIRVVTLGDTLLINFARGSLDIDPKKNTRLSAGIYSGALRFPFAAPAPGLSVSGFGRACNQSSGYFNVYEIEFDNDGQVTRLIADFEQHCEHVVAALRGSIVYDNTLPPAPYQGPALPTGQPFPELPQLQYAGAVMKVVGEPGEYITAGQTWEFDSENSNFVMDSYYRSPRGVRLEVSNLSSKWHMWLVRGSLDIDPEHNAPLAVGVYQAAFRAPFNNPQPGLSYFGAGRGCNESFGKFTVYEIEHDELMNVVKLIADFEQRCFEGSDKVLRGSLHYDVTLPPHPGLPVELPSGSTDPALPTLVYAGAVAQFESRGIVTSLDSTNANFNVSSRGVNQTGLRLDIVSARNNHDVNLRRGSLDIDQNRETPLTVGIYRNALGTPFPEIGFAHGAGLGCGLSQNLQGEFRIFEIVYNSDGNIDRLVADFKKICPDQTVPWKGSIHYDATLPAYPYSPPPPCY